MKPTSSSSSSSSTQKKFQKNMYSSLPLAADDEEAPGGDDGEEEEETVQLNNVPLSLSELMALSKNTVNSAMNIAIQGKNSLNEFISSTTSSQSDGSSAPRVNRGTYGNTSTGSAVGPPSHLPSDDTMTNSML
jgi:hypothetical protein